MVTRASAFRVLARRVQTKRLEATAMRALWQSGSIVGGRYRLRERIGRGSTGEVWRARHVTLNQVVAIKLVDWGARDDGDALLARLEQEARLVSELRTPNVARVLDHGAEGPVAFLVMELLEGENLADRLARKGTLPPNEVAHLVLSVAHAVERAHAAGVLHRDLKPSNIFITVDEKGERLVKVLDFGIAKRIGAALPSAIETAAFAMVGTPAYMSPEMVRGEELDERSDLWQLAIVAYECLCGERPFDGSSLADLYLGICSRPPPVPSRVAQVPVGFDAWFARATRRERGARFGSAADLAQSFLEAMQTSASAPPPPPSSFPAMPRADASASWWRGALALPRAAQVAILAAPLALTTFGAMLHAALEDRPPSVARVDARDVERDALRPDLTGAVATSPSRPASKDTTMKKEASKK